MPLQANIFTALKNESAVNNLILVFASYFDAPYEGNDLNAIIHTMLQCLSDISQNRFYGENVLLNVLRGAQEEKLRKAGLNEVPAYGSPKEIDREELSCILHWLSEKHLLLQTKGPHPVLHPTYDGLHYSETMTRSQILALRKKLQEADTPGAVD